MLNTLCQYNDVEITHTLSSNEQPIVTVRCLKHTSTIEITYLKNNSVKLYDNLEESAEAIQLVINQYAIV